MAGLERREGHGRARPRRRAAHLPRIAIEAGRDIHRQYRDIPHIHTRDEGASLTVDIARQAGAEHGIDHERRCGRIGAVERLHRPLPRRRSLRGIPGQGFTRAQQRNPNRVTAAGQHARGHEPVPAIVARPTDDEDGAARRQKTHRDIGDRAPGPLHQARARRAGRDGGGIRRAHRRDGEQLVFSNGRGHASPESQP